MTKIGSKIKSLIQGSEYNVKEIADKIGISAPNIYRLYERDSVETKYLVALAEIYKVSISYFFNGEEVSELSGEIADLKEEIKKRDETIIQLKEKNAMLEKLNEHHEERLQKRKELDRFLDLFFEAAGDDDFKEPGYNTSGLLYKFAQSLLKEGEINAYSLISSMNDDPDINRLINMTLKKIKRSL